MELPDDLLRLEAALAGRQKAEPSPSLRGRVLGAVRAEFGRTASRRSARPGFWSFAAGAAAAALICANVAAPLTRATDCGLRRAPAPEHLRAAARQIREALPELTEREALRQALLLEAGAPAAPLPVLHAAPAGRNMADAAKEG